MSFSSVWLASVRGVELLIVAFLRSKSMLSNLTEAGSNKKVKYWSVQTSPRSGAFPQMAVSDADRAFLEDGVRMRK